MAKRAHEVKEALMAKDDPGRAARMAQALRDNLKRRKAQAREVGAREVRGEAEAPVTPPAEPSGR